jgi:pimeloyl-ACP methyl ester carboxylesterase
MELPPDVEVEGVAHAAVALDGFAAHVASAGEGAPVVLLHGWPGHWWTWRHLIAPLVADGRRVVCPDLRGFGWSSAVAPGDVGFERFASDVVDLLDALGLERVDLVGHDWGSYCGFIACLRWPSRFRRYVAMSAPSPHVPFRLSVVPHLWRLWYQQVLAAPLVGPRTVLGLGSAGSRVGRFVGLDRLSAEEREVFCSRLRDPERVAASVGLYRHAVRHAGRLPLTRFYRRARLTVPTLAIHGALDAPTHPSLMRLSGVKADDFRLELLDGVGHFTPDEAPERVDALVREFLAA